MTKPDSLRVIKAYCFTMHCQTTRVNKHPNKRYEMMLKPGKKQINNQITWFFEVFNAFRISEYKVAIL